ncbi:hypothetical protein MFFC18_18420 [Mariniblastus fucicola]|uniref:Uncharacterized protein n=1 Tax=Mariniblastus fucicola TaxID=980251 RepID=A0A5B9PGG3_9BACT|nr:hypothetical protein MFFC18_18420 [Mariniblastus fucicola]
MQINSNQRVSLVDIPETSPIPAVLLWIFLSFTFVLAFINSLQEQVPGFGNVILVTVGAVISQFPGLAVAELYRRKPTRIRFLFLAPAFLVSQISIFGYLLLVMAGQLQTVDNAAQMHVFLVPILLIIFTAGVYLLAAIIAGVIAWPNHGRQ